MTILQSTILGLVQGLTEFLPVSSSGHLIIIRKFLNLPLENTLAFDVLLHMATLLAIVFYFWGDIRAIWHDAKTEGLSARSSKLIYAIITGSIPAVFLGYFFWDIIENTFRNPTYVAYALIAGSLLFLVADRSSNFIRQSKSAREGLSVFKGFIIGIFQSLALISGFSRSGSTISGGLLMGLSREESIKFAFLLGIPVIAGAGLKTLLDLTAIDLALFQYSMLQYIVGFLAALVSGLWAVKFLVRYLSRNSFTIFIIYRIILAIVILTLL